MEICSLENSLNIPIGDMEKEESMKKLEKLLSADSEIIVICRRGNDSQIAVQKLREKLNGNGRNILIRDVVGGLHSWARSVDPTFPIY
jgi:adenylyltransferase/sulfurtransferase